MQVDEHYISIDNRKIFTSLINWNSANSKPVLVLLHDALGSVAQWKKYPQNLAQLTDLPILTYDRFGHGLSDPELTPPDARFFDREALVILPEILHHFKVDNPIMYGHSDGGTIALIYASKIQTSALILEAAHVMVEAITRKGVFETRESGKEIIGKLEAYHGKKAKDLFKYWADLWSGELMKDWNIEYLLGRIDVPSLIIQGENDNYGTVKQVNMIAEGISHPASISMIENCGHAPHKEQPEIVLEQLNAFLIKNHLLNHNS